MTLEQYKLIDFLEWCEHNGFINYQESLKAYIVEEYTKQERIKIKK